MEFRTGDILSEDAEAIVNTVNCVGVMGRGIALQFKKAYPDNFNAYAAACKRNEVQPGKMFVFETGQLTNPRFIINFPTKRHWRGKSRIEDIETGLTHLVEVIQKLGIRSIAIPPLGSGLGGLDWQSVRQRIESQLGGLENTRIVVFEPNGGPDRGQVYRNQEVPEMTPGRAALVGLMNRYIAGSLDPFVTLLEVHKLMYFMQAAGEPLRLQYQKALYGPYAENLRHVLTRVEGHLVSGYKDGGDDPSKTLELVPGAIEDAEAFIDKNHDTKRRFEQVVDLVQGFESPFGLELLSTVHWVAIETGSRDLGEIRNAVRNWNARKSMFSERQVKIAYEALESRGWLQPV